MFHDLQVTCDYDGDDVFCHVDSNTMTLNIERQEQEIVVSTVFPQLGRQDQPAVQIWWGDDHREPNTGNVLTKNSAEATVKKW
jgi:hypothetical protein